MEAWEGGEGRGDVLEVLGGSDVDGSVVGDAEDARVGVEVLVQRKLEDRGASVTTHEPVSTPKESITKDGTHRAMMTDHARKKAQILYQRSPYFSTTLSLFETQLLYQCQMVAE